MSGQGAAKPRRIAAAEWLIEIFRKQQEWPSSLFWSEAKQAGISKNAIDEAKARLKIPRCRRVGGANGDINWIWWVPLDWPYLHHDEAEKPCGENPPGELGELPSF